MPSNTYDWQTGQGTHYWTPEDSEAAAVPTAQIDPRQIAALGGPAGSVDQVRKGDGLMDLIIKRQLAQKQQAPAQQQGPSRVAMRRQELMKQGLSADQAVQQMGQEGTLPQKLVEHMLSVSRAVPGA
jgi:hypothetical protein